MNISPLIDTHLHLIYRDRLNYPWLASVPPLNQDFLLERYEIEARRCGVTDALHMEVDVAPGDIEAEIGNIAELAAGPGRLLRGAISACRPESPDFPAFLERQLTDPFVRGFRRVLHVVPDDLSRTPLFRENIRRLSHKGRPFDLCIGSGKIDIATALADAAPDAQFVLDHCGNPDIKARAEHPWREQIAEIARRANVAIKISGLVNNGDEDAWTVADLQPYFEHVIASFGWDRVVWGSDWPVCTLAATLSTWVAATQALVRGCAASERDRLFAGNARRIWGLA